MVLNLIANSIGSLLPLPVLIAAATGHACLLSLAKLAPRFAWARLVALTAVYALPCLIVMTIYFEPTGDMGLRIIGTTSIAL